MEEPTLNPFALSVDLASKRVGGMALAASDEFFAPKENLLKPGRGVFIPDKYTDRGKWMDGWETRRKRTPGHDWCIVRLGLPGIIQGVDVDTNHFLGNNPSFVSLEACAAASSATASTLTSAKISWTEILPKSAVKPGSQNLFPVSAAGRWTHVRLNIFPDGGVARLRIHGTVVPSWANIADSRPLDLAAIQNGGLAVAASDMFFSPMNNLIMPGRADTMGDGWETRRRRGPGHDWVVIKLGAKGMIGKIEVDTNHFKGNYPDQCSIDICHESARTIDPLTVEKVSWTEILPMTKLKPHRRHLFGKELVKAGPATHVRLNIYPDGGVSRLRVWGKTLE